MPRVCTICIHPEKTSIDSALVSGLAISAIAALFRVSDDALSRHKSNHIPAKLALAREASEVALADKLLDEVRSLQARTLNILDKAEDSGDLRTALGAIREARSNVELLAKLVGELDDRPVINLYLSSEWLEVRAVIVGALDHHHAARESVLTALEGMGNGRA